MAICGVVPEIAEVIIGSGIKTVITEIVEGTVQKVAAVIEQTAGDSGELGVIQLDRLKKLFHHFLSLLSWSAKCCDSDKGGSCSRPNSLAKARVSACALKRNTALLTLLDAFLTPF
jgi:hypothetical protein